MTFPQLVIVCTGGFAVLFVLGWCAHYWRDQRREWPLTFEEQATADTFAAMERPPELHHEDAPAPVLAALTAGLDAVPPPGAAEEVMPSAAGLLPARVTSGGVPYRPRHGPTEPTAVWPRPPRQPMPPILPPACGPAVAVLGLVIARVQDARDAQRWPHLQRQWEYPTGAFTAIDAAIAKAGK